MSDDLVERRVVGPGFHERVYALVETVPAGRVTTYGDVATVLGSPRVARHVGWALAALEPGQARVPWFRVINGKGRISYRGDTWRGTQQADRLRAEGVRFNDSGTVIGFQQLRWHYPDHAGG